MFKKDSLYSINKKNPDAVVYKFANGEESRITRADFATEDEFLAFKAWSDEDLHIEDKREVLAGIRQVSIDDISEAAISTPAVDVVMEATRFLPFLPFLFRVGFGHQTRGVIKLEAVGTISSRAMRRSGLMKPTMSL